MSQEKVQKYKEEKANRKKNLKKQKRLHRLTIIGYSLLVLALVGFLGWSVYDRYIKKDPEPVTMSEEEWSKFYEEYMATYQPTQAVTDKNGETVTDENGEVVTEIVETEPASDNGTTNEGETTKKEETTKKDEPASEKEATSAESESTSKEAETTSKAE